MPRYPAFVVGSPRSGTSALVDVMLAAEYSGFREGMFLSLMQNFDQLIDIHYRTYWESTGAVLVSVIDKDDFKNRIFGVFRDLADQHNTKAPWFDKTGNPEMILAIPILRKLWPDSVFIFAKRRGLENITSRIRKFPDHTFEYHCKDWARNMAAWRQVRGGLPESAYTEVDQQDMIQRPDAVADHLGFFLDLPPERRLALVDTMRSNRPQQTEAGSAARLLSLGSTGWSETQVDIFLEHCVAEMDAYGYTLDESYTSRR